MSNQDLMQLVVITESVFVLLLGEQTCVFPDKIVALLLLVSKLNAPLPYYLYKSLRKEENYFVFHFQLFFLKVATLRQELAAARAAYQAAEDKYSNEMLLHADDMLVSYLLIF